MGARTGQDYIDRLAQTRPNVELNGESLEGPIPEHPALSGIVRTYAQLFDLQYDPELRDVLTYESPTSGERVGTSFLVPRGAEDLDRRRAAFKAWADYGLGFLGRTGDYLNSSLMALSEASDWFAQADPRFGENIRAYYERVREEDLLTTHTLIPPQANRAVGAGQQVDGRALGAHVISQDDNGIIVRGARMLATIGPIADELLVFPSTVLRGTPGDEPYSFAFAVACDAPGLHFICRENIDYGRDHPLGGRFDEIDAVVVFDDVHVAWERVFMLGHPELCNGFYTETSAVVHMTHQVTSRTTAKTETFLGLLSLMTEAIGIEQFSHIQEDIAEVVVMLSVMRALVRAAEADAEPNRYGVFTPAWEPLNAARNWFPKASQRLPELVRKFGASGLMAIPTEGDIAGRAADEIGTYLQSATLSGPERIRLFRLAWDASTSAFAGRQNLYEHYFFGDPVRMAGALLKSSDREPHKAHVRAFLQRIADEPAQTGALT
ncbi:MAG TPA: 4-hydroxyphenylacetate 3-monooxygenase, oxygenase component [Solirubrobacteraceae bacterium]|nr:4-hydroxyphenylacetate 3-monooxygenase, oxygenase component [Solirubrobacteraceae bacterium]